MVYKHPGIDIVNLRNDIHQAIKKHKAEKKYRAQLVNLEFNKDYVSESVIAGIDIDLDNKLRNYAYHQKIPACKRINHFLTQTMAEYVLNKEEGDQRPDKDDKHAKRWRKYCTRKKRKKYDEDKGQRAANDK